jgi:uncharacterized protein YjbI with pentapeptide repeats
LKKPVKIILIIVLLALASGITWWQLNKKGIIRHQIEKAVANGTDSIYYIRYDSSKVDAAAGNAVFYNVVLQSDSLQQQLYTDDTSSIPATIFNVHIERVSIFGANIPSFLKKNKVEANTIEIYHPVITLISTGKDEPVKFSAADTLALYEKITGKFNSIRAGQIKITDGTIAFARGKKSPHITLQGVNADLRNLKIDSTRDYDNLISYFIKDVKATVKTATVKNEKGGRLLTFEGIEYNAPGRFLKVDRFSQTNLSQNKVMIDLRNSRVSGISTNAFIINRQLKADSLTTDGGVLGIYRIQKATGSETLEMDNDFFDEALVKNIRLSSTDLYLFDRSNKSAAPITLKNVKFNAADLDSVYSGTNIMWLIGNSKWNLSADGTSFTTADKMYRIGIGPFVLDNEKSVIAIKEATVRSVSSRAAFVKSLRFQKDLYDLRFNNIKLTGADVRKLIADRMIIAEEASVQPILKIFNDRTVDPDTASKIGLYPQQILQKLHTPVYIKTIRANDASVIYTERGALSKQIGVVTFDNITGRIRNFTNIDSYKKKNSLMVMNVDCKFLKMASIKSEWKFPLTAPDGAFGITGSIGPFSGPGLNPVIEPLGMGSIRSGEIKGFDFSMTGDDLKAGGSGTLLYNDLKIKLLKNPNEDNKLKNKSVTSFVANLVMLDNNPSKGVTRKSDLAFKRITTRTFFNLVWKSIFAGAKSATR